MIILIFKYLSIFSSLTSPTTNQILTSAPPKKSLELDPKRNETGPWSAEQLVLFTSCFKRLLFVYYIPVSRLKNLENKPFYSFPKAWSLLTDHSITIIRNCAEFNAKLKEHFLEKLSFTVNCTKAFCPSCNRFLNV